MNAKEYLSQGLWLDKIIENKFDQLKEYRVLVENLNGDNTQEKVSGNNYNTCRMATTIAKIIDLENEIKANIDKMIDLKQDILKNINQLDKLNYRLLLELRYVCGKTWEEISEEFHCSSSGIFKIHGIALKKIEKILKLSSKVE
jgi:DNA-directed RNA polymerase specialized sigma subunit